MKLDYQKYLAEEDADYKRRYPEDFPSLWQLLALTIVGGCLFVVVVYVFIAAVLL